MGKGRGKGEREGSELREEGRMEVAKERGGACGEEGGRRGREGE